MMCIDVFINSSKEQFFPFSPHLINIVLWEYIAPWGIGKIRAKTFPICIFVIVNDLWSLIWTGNKDIKVETNNVMIWISKATVYLNISQMSRSVGLD